MPPPAARRRACARPRRQSVSDSREARSCGEPRLRDGTRADKLEDVPLVFGEKSGLAPGDQDRRRDRLDDASADAFLPKPRERIAPQSAFVGIEIVRAEDRALA